MEEQNFVENKPLNDGQNSAKKAYWKFVIAFLAIMIVAAGGFFVWQKYFSPAAKLERQTHENYQKYLDESNFKAR